jgi:hypothetical protein
MFELIDDSDKDRTRRNLFVWGIICAVFLLAMFSEFLHHDLFRVIVIPSFALIGTRDYWKRINSYLPSHLWMIVRIVPPILMAVAGWYLWWAFFLISTMGSALVLVGLEDYLKRRARNRGQLAEIDEEQR